MAPDAFSLATRMEGMTMRTQTFFSLLALSAPALAALPAAAQTPPLEIPGWCALITAPDGGYVTCDYRTRAQCLAALSGVGGICHENPAIDGPRLERGEKARGNRN